MDINKYLFVFVTIYIFICIGSFIRCKSYGISSNIAYCFLLAVPPILLSAIFILPIALVGLKKHSSKIKTIKDYFKLVSVVSRMAPIIVLLLGLVAQDIVDKITNTESNHYDSMNLKQYFSALKTAYNIIS